MKTLALPFSLSAVLLAGCAHSSPPPAAPLTARAQLVQVVAAQEPETIRAAGTLHARETAVISAQVPGPIRRVLVQAGERVRAGQLLVTLDDEALESMLSQSTAGERAAQEQVLAAQSEASLATQTLARYQMLKDQKSVSPQEFDEVEKHSEAAELRVASYHAQAEQAKAAVTGARVQLGYSALRAPFSGVVTARLADPGSLAAPGVPLLQIDRDGPLQASISVDESLIGSLRTGMRLAVNLQGAQPISGTVTEIVPAADPASRTFLIKIDLPPSSGLRAGMYATAEIPGETKPAILVPFSAIVQRGSLACVYALDGNGLAQLRYVTLGNRHGNQVEILSGVSAKETLVNQPGERELAGKRIEAEP
ncbi:MAG TPA: efflux RND transporter periplasmic adaptor subunit [Acidobacteriaceae bacterium]|jgi:RND family efflux transporter MFP subunit|nr:efflux RND transporter periplasmic adaptor subunit [Acidobacteriaceae bacterium]